MLDIEQNDQQDNTESPSPPAAVDTSPPPRRRRAATRPAGPPTVPTEARDTPAEGPADSATSVHTASAPVKKTAKRAPRKTASTPDGATPRTPRKRATKKAAAAPTAEPEVQAEAVPQPSLQPEPKLQAESEPVEARSGDGAVLAASEAALLAAVEGAVASGEAATVLAQPDSDVPSGAGETWLPAEQATDVEHDAAQAPVAEQPVVERPVSAEPVAEEPVAEEPVVEQLVEEPVAEEPQRESEEIEAEQTEGEQTEGEQTEGEETEAEETEGEETEGEETEGEETDEEPTRRRRRRRGGRRRRRGGDGANGDAGSAEGAEDTGDGARERAEAAVEDQSADLRDESAAEDTDDASAGEGEGARRRRRRRRRRGEESSGSPDDPVDVVVRVREPRARRKASEEPAGIEGSTRLEAKRQRRREGREAGRRRAPILSEAEFLARRESVKRSMVIRQRTDTSTGAAGALTQIAVLEDDILVEHYVDRDSAASLIGNVYLGRVQNVLPSMEAAFIDIGRGRNAVLYAGEVDWDAFGAEGQARKVEKVLKSGQTVLVQVTKDPVGAKGARLTNHVSIPGRYIVYAPGGHLSGISRKLPDTERRRLKDILADLVPESASVIVRTAAEGATEEELVRDVNRLKAQWEDIEKKVKAGQAPLLLYGEPDLTLRIVRDLFTEDFSELLVAGNNGPDDAYDSIEAYVGHVAPHLAARLERWTGEDGGGSDIFAVHRIDEQIAKALERKVFLPSGGSLVIDRTEAMTVIDVNTGKFTGTGGNLEATVTSNNLEAAEEIVRQLRLRDIGGIIVIDFIDMVLPSNRELLLRRLVECLGRDRTRHQVAEVTSLGLVQMTRKRIGTGLLEAFSTECEVCHGRGYEIHDVPVESQKQADGGARDRGRQRGGRRGSGRDGSGGSDGQAGSNGAGSDSADHRQEVGDRTAERSGDAVAPVG